VQLRRPERHCRRHHELRYSLHKHRQYVELDGDELELRHGRIDKLLDGRRWQRRRDEQ
jgi:hypothetical protein